MRLLDRYLLREFLIPLGYCLSAFLVFWIAFDLFNELQMFQQHRLKLVDIAQVYLFKMPDILSFPVLPVALLLGLLYCLSNHSRHHELVAIRAAGVSMWRISLPYLLVGTFCSIGIFVLSDVLMPHSTESVERTLNKYIDQGENAAQRKWVFNLSFTNDRDGRDWHLGAYNLENSSITNAQVAWKQPDGSKHTFIAETGGWTNGVWLFYNVQIFIYRTFNDPIPLRESTNTLQFNSWSETPDQIKSEVRINALSNFKASKKPRFSIVEIMDYLRLHPHLQGERKAFLYTQLHARLAAPWTCLVVILIGIPFGARTGQRNVFVGVASSIVLCFAYFMASRFGLAMGTNGTLPAWLAAWGPNLLFGTAGVIMTMRQR